MLQMMGSYLSIYLSSLDICMSKQDLNIANVGSTFQQMRSKTMTKRMKTRFFLYSGFSHRMLKDMLSRSLGQGTTTLLRMKQRIII